MQPEKKVQFGSLKNRLAQFENPPPRPIRPALRPTPSKLFPGNHDNGPSTQPVESAKKPLPLPDVASLLSKPGPGSVLYTSGMGSTTRRQSEPLTQTEKKVPSELRSVSAKSSLTDLRKETLESRLLAPGIITSIPSTTNSKVVEGPAEGNNIVGAVADENELLASGVTGIPSANSGVVEDPGRGNETVGAAAAEESAGFPPAPECQQKHPEMETTTLHAPNTAALNLDVQQNSTPAVRDQNSGEQEANQSRTGVAESTEKEAPQVGREPSDSGPTEASHPPADFGKDMKADKSDNSLTVHVSAAEANESALLAQIEAMNNKLELDVRAATAGTDVAPSPQQERGSRSWSVASFFFARSRPGDAGPEPSIQGEGDGGADRESVARLRSLVEVRRTLNATLATAEEEEVSLSNDLVSARLGLARHSDLNEALTRQISELKELIDGRGAKAMVDDMISKLEKRISALDHRASVAEKASEALRAELAAAEVSQSESKAECSRWQQKCDEVEKEINSR